MLMLVLVQKSVSNDRLYAVTDDGATVAYLLKRIREMDPQGAGIVRSEFKKYVLSRMHSGSLKQNHRLWRRLQTRMQKQGVLELDVHMVSCVRTTHVDSENLLEDMEARAFFQRQGVLRA